MRFKIDKKEVLRYLNIFKNLDDENINKLIDESIVEIKKIINFRYLYQKFNIENRKKGISIKNTTLILKGESIKEHLKNSEEIYLMAATLGSEIDRKISYYEKKSVTKSMIFDACATTAIEEACDQLEKEIKEKVLTAGNEAITFRYSPGYGDLSIAIQKEFLRILKAPKKIGLTASKYNMLLPTKSVTAIIGIIKEKPKSKQKTKIKKYNKNIKKSAEGQKSESSFKDCQNCLLSEECELKKRRIYCGFKK